MRSATSTVTAWGSVEGQSKDDLPDASLAMGVLAFLGHLLLLFVFPFLLYCFYSLGGRWSMVECTLLSLRD